MTASVLPLVPHRIVRGDQIRRARKHGELRLELWLAWMERELYRIVEDAVAKDGRH